jgi:hypothetical protein
MKVSSSIRLRWAVAVGTSQNSPWSSLPESQALPHIWAQHRNSSKHSALRNATPWGEQFMLEPDRTRHGVPSQKAKCSPTSGHRTSPLVNTPHPGMIHPEVRFCCWNQSELAMEFPPREPSTPTSGHRIPPLVNTPHSGMLRPWGELHLTKKHGPSA